jgi:asparagine synthase (glutamine-hydrolysing)
MSNFIGFFEKTDQIKNHLSKPFDGFTDEGQLLVSKDIVQASIEDSRIYFSGKVYNLEGTTEIIAKSILSDYLNEGVVSFKKLDGEFTFVIIANNETLIFRDRHGADAQIYYTTKVYSPFLKNLLAVKGFSPEPNQEAIATFLSLGYVPSPMCSLVGVTKLPAGNVLRFANGVQKVESLFKWEEYKEACSNPQNISEEDATAQYEELHKKAIKLRVDGKKNVGLLLSGGYDSGGNIAGLREVYSGDALSYSIGFKDNPWTELPLAKVLSERFDTKHHEYEIDGSEIKDLPALVEYLGDPFQEGGLMVNYAVMKLIGEEKPDVILGGDGNDQHFGTAGKELALNYKFKKKGYSIAQNIFASFGSMGIFDKDNIFFRSQFHNEKILHIQKSDNFGFKAHDLKRLSKVKHNFGPHKYLEPVPKTFTSFDEFYFTHNYFGDIKQVINEVILFKASKMSSMFGNNLSFPYMNTEIYDFLKTLPREFKCKGSLDDLSKGKGISKFLHKNYLKPKLPTEITDRKKQGGFAPLPIFFKDNKQRKKLEQFVLESDAAKQLFSEKYLRKFFSAYDSTVETGGYWFWYKQVKAFQFFNLIVICLWWEIFINDKSKEELAGFIN